MAADMTVAFIGAFERQTDAGNRATSSAGNQVQCEIVDALENARHDRGFRVRVFAAKPMSAWPKGPLWNEAGEIGGAKASVLNIPFLKRIHSAAKSFRFLYSSRPKIIFSYNPGAFDSLALLLFRSLNHDRIFLISIIQDLHVEPGLSFGLRWLGDLVAIRLAHWFDLLMPVSETIADDFHFDRSKVIVFNGGLTRQSRELLGVNCASLSPCAVFAGALESYNGIDRLITAWTNLEEDLVLHIFGKGSYESAVHDAALRSSKIVYHGFAPEEVVTRWQSSARVNFCLRYSVGINARYFFPSKLCNVLAAPGVVVTNAFDGLPVDLRKFCCVVRDDLSDLGKVLGSMKLDSNFQSILDARRLWLKNNADWNRIIFRALDISATVS